MTENGEGLYEYKMRLPGSITQRKGRGLWEIRTPLHRRSLGRGNWHQNKDFDPHSKILRVFAHAL